MHPWVWINEPQHSAAVQAVTACIATIAAIIAAIFAVFAFLWERKQVAEAHAQTQFTRKQSVAAEQQLKLAEMAYQEERDQRRTVAEAQYREAVTTYRNRLFEETATRMKLAFGSTEPSSFEARTIFNLVNMGVAAGLNVRIFDPHFETAQIAQELVLPPQGRLRLTIDYTAFATRGVLCKFTGRFGTLWTIRLTLDGREIREEVISEIRGYRKPELPFGVWIEDDDLDGTEQ